VLAAPTIGLAKEARVNRIVLGYDASPAAERALQRVLELATALRAPVVVVSVAPAHELAAPGLASVQPDERHTQIARDAVSRLAEHGIDARAVTGLGHAAETLVDLADATSADLIVVGMSSRDLVARIFGGTSDDVAHGAHCDVLLVH
jgi:nucleotide-binding universal stress UspA family protein